MKRTIPLLITAVGGFILIIAYFIPATQTWGEVAAIWFDVLASIAFILGGGNLIKIHFRSFRSWKTCLKFKKNLKKRFDRFSNNKLFLYPNIAHTKIRYFYIKRKKNAGIK